jgi:cellobiose transport system permease protein
MVTAVMLNSAVRLKNVYRFAYFLPDVTSVVAVAIVFGSAFSTNFGLVPPWCRRSASIRWRG